MLQLEDIVQSADVIQLDEKIFNLSLGDTIEVIRDYFDKLGDKITLTTEKGDMFVSVDYGISWKQLVKPN